MRIKWTRNTAAVAALLSALCLSANANAAEDSGKAYDHNRVDENADKPLTSAHIRRFHGLLPPQKSALH